MKKVAVLSLKVSIILSATITGLILLIPYIAMQFSDEVAWTASDFVFAGGLIFATTLASLVATQRIVNIQKRYLVVGLIILSSLLVWVEGAVGIFD